MKNCSWGIESFNDSPIHIVLFVSRNKDNKDIEGFKERRQFFITNEPIDSSKLKVKFANFAAEGVEGETSRMYYSVNARDGKKIYQQLLHFLIDNPDFNLCSIQPKLAGIAAAKECALTKHWMFDLDTDDGYAAWAVCQNIRLYAPDVEIKKYKTPHGYAIVVNHGFDTRPLMELWEKIDIDITLKRDDLLCIKWITKPND